MKKDQRNLAQTQTQQAMAKYHARYDNVTYIKAIEGKSSKYANALTDDALALCGHPHYKLSYRRWSKEALEHLTLFDIGNNARSPKTVEFKVKVPTVKWENIPVCHKDQVECPADAVLIARTLSLTNNGYQVRCNYENSFQGHYVGPFLGGSIK